MDEKKRKKPSSKKPAKAARPKKKAASKSKDGGNPTPEERKFDFSALSAIMEANKAHAKKEGEGIKSMSQNMQEYLSNFILIGYTMDGNPVNITYAPTAKDYDCLSTGLQRYILDQGGPGPFGP